MKNDYQVQTLKAHVSLNVNNVENSIEFYQKLFGIEPAKVRCAESALKSGFE
jgi:predicted enzyme related to lactoylglutathione lyase